MDTDNDRAILARLEELDDFPLDAPPELDYEAAIRRFEAFVRDFERELGAPERVETRSYIQDASFHSQLLPRFPNNQGHWLRFSNFDDMVSLYQDDRVPPELLDRIVALARRHGYRFVPYRLLALPRPNAQREEASPPDWFRRFFDWY